MPTNVRTSAATAATTAARSATYEVSVLTSIRINATGAGRAAIGERTVRTRGSRSSKRSRSDSESMFLKPVRGLFCDDAGPGRGGDAGAGGGLNRPERDFKNSGAANIFNGKKKSDNDILEQFRAAKSSQSLKMKSARDVYGDLRACNICGQTGHIARDCGMRTAL